MCLTLRVWFLRHFGLKTGMDFAHFGLESGMEMYERIYLSFQCQMNMKERVICTLNLLLS